MLHLRSDRCAGRIYSFFPGRIFNFNPGRHVPDFGEKESVGGLHEAWQGTSEHINWDLDHKKIITRSVKAISAN